MIKVRQNLRSFRKVVAIAISLTGVTMFSSCSSGESDSPPILLFVLLAIVVVAIFAIISNAKNKKSANESYAGTQEFEKSDRKNENVEGALDSVQIITDQKQLLKIAEKSTEEEKLAYQILVATNYQQGGNVDFSILHMAVDSLTNQNLIADVAKNNKYAGIRSAAVKKLTIQKVLIDIAKNDGNIDVRRNAIGFVTDQSVLTNIAKNDRQSGARESAIYHLDDQELLAYIALNDRENRYAAFGRITDQNILTKLAKNDKDEDVREWALEALKSEEPN